MKPKLGTLLYLFAMAIVTASLLYSVFTGEAIGTDTHYDTLGRVMNAIFCAFALGYGLWMGRKLWHLQRARRDRKDNT